MWLRSESRNKIKLYYINTNENIPGELLCENLIFRM